MAVAIIMGSGNDFDKVKPVIETLKQFEVPVEVRVLSAHRSPNETLDYVKAAKDNGIQIIIAAAGKAAHLPGIIAGVCDLPVIGLPISSSLMGGLDSLLSIVQMPGGVPVMTVALDGAVNAALAAIRILALSDSNLAKKQTDYIETMRQDVLQQDEIVQGKINQ